MKVTGLAVRHAPYLLSQDALPDRPLARARRRVVEHPDPGRCATQGRGRRRMNIRETPSAAVERGAAPAQAAKPMDPRTKALLEGPIVPTLIRLAWPNVIILFAQASTGLIETYWVGRLGTDALAGMALVFPGMMLMQMISAGAM